MKAVLEPVDDAEVGVVLLLQLVHLAVQFRDLALQIRNHLKNPDGQLRHVDMDKVKEKKKKDKNKYRDEEMIQFGHGDLDNGH